MDTALRNFDLKIAQTAAPILARRLGIRISDLVSDLLPLQEFVLDQGGPEIDFEILREAVESF